MSRGSDSDRDGGHEEMSLLLPGWLPRQGWVSGQECTPAGAPSVTPAGRGADTGPFHPKHREPLALLSSLTREA